MATPPPESTFSETPYGQLSEAQLVAEAAASSGLTVMEAPTTPTTIPSPHPVLHLQYAEVQQAPDVLTESPLQD